MQIEYLGEYKTDVYDITVADNHNFFGNDILTHNCDTDSVDSTSLIKVSINEKLNDVTISDLFSMGDTFWKHGDKEYSRNKNIKIAHYNNDGVSSYVGYNYVYRHKASKRKFKIKTAGGKEVIVTEDHSVMILENNQLVEKKPTELSSGDKVVTIL